MTQLLDALNKRLDEHVKELVTVVSEGGAKSHDHYKELCGVIRGLQTAQMEIGDLVRKLKDSDDD